MDRKNVIPKQKDDTASSSRKRRAATVEKVSKRKKIEESVSESDSKLKEISDYVDSSEDVAKRSVSGDSKECEGSESNSDDGDNDSLSVPYLSRCISVERYDLRTIIDEVESFPSKISVKSRMTAYREFKQILVDQELKKRFKRSCFGHLRNLPEHLKFNGQLNSTKVVDIKLIRIVDSLNFFEKYPWGKEIFQLTMDYLKKKSDLKKQKKVFDEKQKTSYALFGFPWAFMIWIYEAFPHLGEFAGKSMDEPLPIPRILRWHTSKRDKIIEGDPFKYKGKVTENVHPYIIPTVCETKMDYMIMFESYTDEIKNNVLDGLKKELERVTVLTSNEDSDDDEDLGGNPVGVRVGDDDSLSTSKDAAGTSSLGGLHKCMAALEEAVLDIAAYIKEKRMKKKENDERQHGRVHDETTAEAEEKTTVVGEVRKEGEEEKKTEEETADAHAEKEGEEGENEEAAAIVEKKEVEAVQTDVVMSIVDEINSNTCVDEELRERDI
ncbi:hypothetical protein P3L10_031815 [Capsicum annuum]